MSSVTTLDIQKIDSTVNSFEATEKTIIEGSDEHLDLILDVQQGLSNCATLTKDLVDYIETNFNSYTAATAQELVARVFPCFSLAKKIIALIKASPICLAVKSHLADFENEVNELFEISNDLSNYKVRSSNDYPSLFND